MGFAVRGSEDPVPPAQLRPRPVDPGQRLGGKDAFAVAESENLDKFINNLELQLKSEGGSMHVFKQVTGSVQIRDSPKTADRGNMTSPPLLDANSMENPALFNDIKIEPPEELLANDFNLPQVEPVDLSFHKPKAPLQPASMLQAPIRPLKSHPAPQTLVVSTSTSDTSTSANIPTVLTPGSILAHQGTGSQQILHVIHTIPSVSLPDKLGSLKTIPVVVQSLPMVYTTLPADGGSAAITVPLIGGDGKNAGSGLKRPGLFNPDKLRGAQGNGQGSRHHQQIDTINRWVEAFPTTREMAQVVTEALINHIIPRFGLPNTIQSDNGPAFISRLLNRQLLQEHADRYLLQPVPMSPEAPVNPLNPGDQVLLKAISPKPLQPKWTVLHKIILTTTMAVKVLGDTSWHHLSRVKQFRVDKQYVCEHLGPTQHVTKEYLGTPKLACSKGIQPFMHIKAK
ncbi:Krueppel-like factor 8 [Talpa occidentalis]|uniref:Krueppel-like factor 8 n=1 Tax=Talpa occidentalis TaxID=50954 RepID=UPI0023F63846|nr:Krueppel-like factor 8 [Talpa occidentalis]